MGRAGAAGGGGLRSALTGACAVDSKVDAVLTLDRVSKRYPNGQVAVQELSLTVNDGEVYLLNLHIAPYEQGNQFNHFLKNIAIMGGAVLLFVTGGGRLSVDRSLSIILMGSGISVIRENAIAHELGHVSVIGLDCLGGDGLIGADYFP